MKKQQLLRIAFLINLLWPLLAVSQNTPTLKEKVGVLYIDSKGFSLDPVQMGNMTRLELDKTRLYEVPFLFPIKTGTGSGCRWVLTDAGRIGLISTHHHFFRNHRYPIFRYRNDIRSIIQAAAIEIRNRATGLNFSGLH